MAEVPGLRSPYAMVGRLVYFGRMLDKIRLNAAGKLPPDYCANLGGADKPFVFDARTCLFLRIDYEALKARVLLGGTDAEILAWAESQGTPRPDSDCAMWNQFMMKIGWRDDRTGPLQERVTKYGMAGKGVETAFDFLELDEGRDPVASKPWELRAPCCILIMGVAGSGKTTIGVKLAHALGWSFRDADEFHPPENVAKMAAGIPLDDNDRAPWLAAIHDYMRGTLANGQSTVVTCSALKEKYRQLLLADLGDGAGGEAPKRLERSATDQSDPGAEASNAFVPVGGQATKRLERSATVKLVYLKGDFKLILERIGQRQGHFMKADMLRSQFEALERPAGAFEVDVALPPDEIVRAIRKEFGV